MLRKTHLYAALAAAGGAVPDGAAWLALGQAAGYSGHRDLAGFFGGRRPSMTRLRDGSRVLTADGWSRAR
ncbi:MAG: hypothetical protein QOD71_440 [Thermoleophilaceae bacterium]|jgi:hypothetical protein|nr:hypothetical protein [Thermoleophilaceae bacterium]